MPAVVACFRGLPGEFFSFLLSHGGDGGVQGDQVVRLSCVGKEGGPGKCLSGLSVGLNVFMEAVSLFSGVRPSRSVRAGRASLR